MTGFSTCCHDHLRIEERVESFHGCDDGYELKTPYIICENCNKVQLTILSQMDIETHYKE